MNMLNQYVVALTFTSISIFILGSFILLQSRWRQKLYSTFAFYCFATAFWTFCHARLIISSDPAKAIIWARVLHIGVIFIAVFFLHFVFVFVGIRKKGWILRLAYINGIIFLLLDFFTNLFVANAIPKLSFRYFVEPGPLYLVFISLWLCEVVIGLYYLYLAYSRSTGVKRNQLTYLFFGTLLGYLGGAPNFLPVFYIEIFPLNPFGTYAIPIYVLAATIAIVKYRLMDIKVALTRAGIFATVYFLVLGIPFWIGFRFLGRGTWILPVSIMAVFATLGPFIYQYLRMRAEDVILKDQRRYQKALKELSARMTHIRDIDELLKVIVLAAVDTVKVNFAASYLEDKKRNGYQLKYHYPLSWQERFPGFLPAESAFIKNLFEEKRTLFSEEIKSWNNINSDSGLVIPCFAEDALLGFLIIGAKPKNQIYTSDDILIFETLSYSTALAIENCQFYSQERQHQQYMRAVSLDRQMAGLAHELDNPNYALLGSLGSIELALGDLKDVVPPDKIEYLKKKIERARFNSKRISKMIASVREFSRASTGELEPIKFEWIIEGFLNIIEPQFKYNGITFNKEITDETVWMRANKVEIEQVLVNLSANSIQAINEIWQRGENTAESRKEILFRAYKIHSGVLRIDFSDTGGGIKKELLEDIFLDFVTTKGSAEGTGLGLSISRKIIQKHNGRIWAESEGENKGAAFHIELPIANDLTKDEKQEAENKRGGQGKKDMFIQDFPD